MHAASSDGRRCRGLALARVADMSQLTEEPAPHMAPVRQGVDRLLYDHHDRLDVRCRDLLAAGVGNDRVDLLSVWGRLEAELLDHMAAEDHVILPGYAAHWPRDADRIFDEHTRIRVLVTLIRLDFTLPTIRAERLQRLVDTLGAHSASEERGMYTWATDNLAHVAQDLLGKTVSRWFARG